MPLTAFAVLRSCFALAFMLYGLELATLSQSNPGIAAFFFAIGCDDQHFYAITVS